MKLAEHFSDFMVLTRKGRGLAQVEVVKATGITRSTLSVMECKADQITLTNVEKYLKGMNLQLEDFTAYWRRQHEEFSQIP